MTYTAIGVLLLVLTMSSAKQQDLQQPHDEGLSLEDGYHLDNVVEVAFGSG